MIKFLLISILFSFNCFAEIKFNSDINPNSMSKLHPKVIEIVNWSVEWCKMNDCQIVITSTVRSEKRNKEVGSVSQTHVQGRAVDFSVKPQWGWDKIKLLKYQKAVESKFGKIGAISYSGKIRTIVVIHNAGSGNHAHIQIRKGLPK